MKSIMRLLLIFFSIACSQNLCAESELSLEKAQEIKSYIAAAQALKFSDEEIKAAFVKALENIDANDTVTLSLSDEYKKYVLIATGITATALVAALALYGYNEGWFSKAVQQNQANAPADQNDQQPENPVVEQPENPVVEQPENPVVEQLVQLPDPEVDPVPVDPVPVDPVPVDPVPVDPDPDQQPAIQELVPAPIIPVIQSVPATRKYSKSGTNQPTKRKFIRDGRGQGVNRLGFGRVRVGLPGKCK